MALAETLQCDSMLNALSGASEPELGTHRIARQQREMITTVGVHSERGDLGSDPDTEEELT